MTTLPPRAAPLNSASLAEGYAGASRVVAAVMDGAGLDESMARSLRDCPSSTARAAIQDLSYQTLREYGWVHFIVAALVKKPPVQTLLVALLYVALTDVKRRVRSYVAVDQAVRAVRLLGFHSATGFVNGVLRTFLRQADALTDAARNDPVATWRHPQWWISLLRNAYPDEWESILHAGNQHPPMTLRVNVRRSGVSEYLEKLAGLGIAARPLIDAAIRLERPMPVTELPGFADGWVSVQDAGAQRAAAYLSPRAGQRVLDACAAPGGKTAHLLEVSRCELTAIDIDPRRCARIQSNLDRLGLDARVLEGDATRIGAWWDGKPFDRILVDAPCSASGIARRRPDIKWHRRASDLGRYCAAQSSILSALWEVLAPRGRMLYSTCSLFPGENGECIDRFVTDHRDARAVELPGLRRGQLLPTDDHDGFFFALLEKQ